MRRILAHSLSALSYAAGVACALALLSPAVGAQQANDAGTQPNQTAEPISAYHSPFTSSSDVTDENPESAAPDTRPLSGAQYISMGNLSTNRSYWQPRFDLSGTGDSNAVESASSTNWGTWTSFLAGVDIHRTSGSSEMMLTYTGGGMYSSEANVSNGTVQELGVSENISFRRSVLTLLEQLSYLPQASLGFGGVGQMPSLGGGSTNLGPGFSSGQSILTGQGQNLSNSTVVQLNTFLTPRSSITMAGGYSLLHFFGNSLVDSGDVTFQGGYNYQLTHHDTMALLYAFSDFRYNSLSQSIYTHSIEGSYGRRITGRLAFQVAAGPEIAIFDQGAFGTGGGAGASNSSSTHAYWTLNSSLNYQYEKTALGVTYSHGVGNGSGVLAGSLNDTVSGSFTRRMSRMFSSGLSGGFSRNAVLPIAGISAFGGSYDYWFAGGNLTRPFSETLALTFSYQLQYQTTNGASCTGPYCGTITRHLVTVGLSWHQRPLLF